MALVKSTAGRPKKAAEKDVALKHVGFKADRGTLAALERLVAALTPPSVVRSRARSVVLRRIILERDAQLAEDGWPLAKAPRPENGETS